jgi:hypothetical protein
VQGAADLGQAAGCCLKDCISLLATVMMLQQAAAVQQFTAVQHFAAVQQKQRPLLADDAPCKCSQPAMRCDIGFRRAHSKCYGLMGNVMVMSTQR